VICNFERVKIVQIVTKAAVSVAKALRMAKEIEREIEFEKPARLGCLVERFVGP